VQGSIDSGLKLDGSGPIGDVNALERNLDLEPSEHVAYLTANARAAADGTLTVDEAQSVYVALGECLGSWPAETSLALKVTVTNLMGQLLTRA
jgi:hypothetical protein